jgi:hypothetical protein
MADVKDYAMPLVNGPFKQELRPNCTEEFVALLSRDRQVPAARLGSRWALSCYVRSFQTLIGYGTHFDGS